MTLHVLPVADVIEHVDSDDCVCGPDLVHVESDGCSCVVDTVGFTDTASGEGDADAA